MVRRVGLALGLGLLGAVALLGACNALTGSDDIDIVPGSGGGATSTTASTTATTSSTGSTTATGSGGEAGSGGAFDAGADAEPDAGLDPDGDEDLDGRLNGVDNCPLVFNPCQYDLDNDGIGDACDVSCEEHCSVRTCSWPDAQGCNCSNDCPPLYRCVTDYDFSHGFSGDRLLPDGGTYHCDPEFWKVCARNCSEQDPCPIGTCYELQVGSGCICYSFAMLLPCF